MTAITSKQLAEILGVAIAAGPAEGLIDAGVSTDTRTLPAGSVFFALRGENFDGDRFARQAIEKGARAVVVHGWDGPAPEDAAVIVVGDALLALQRLACWWRQQLKLPVVSITGSNGKTSTKDFTAAVLSRRYHVSATRGNLNNHIGVPLTVLATTAEHTAAVWELGMNHPGEIAPLCEISRPRYGIITNIGTAHIEFLGSREAIAEEKGMLARALPSEGSLVLPATCEFFEYFRQRTHASVVPVGNSRRVVRAEGLRTAPDGSQFTLAIDGCEPAEVFLPVVGRHMVTNALLAAAVGWKLGLGPDEIAAGLAETVLTGGRLRRFEHRGITVIDDTYNANPESMAAAIDTLADTPVSAGARRIIVLGRMGELGGHAAAAHLRTGRLAAARGLTAVAVGEGAEGIAEGAGSCPFFTDPDEAAQWLAREARTGDAVLFKGSRAAAIERVMHAAFPSP